MNFTSFSKTLVESDNDSGMIIGKFKILTKERAQLINSIIRQIGKATIVVVNSKNPTPIQLLKYKALQLAFGKNKNVEIIQTNDVYIPDIIQHCSFNPLVLFCSPTHTKDYESMINSINLNIQISEIEDEDISATKVITNLNDQTFFEKNTPAAIHPLYNEYVQNYPSLMSESFDIFDTLDEDEYRPSNDYQNTYPSADYDDERVRVPGDNENFDVYDTIKGEESDLTPSTDDAENKTGSCVFDCPEINEDGEAVSSADCADSDCSGLGTGTSDIAQVDSVIMGNVVRRKKPELVTEHKSFADYFGM